MGTSMTKERLERYRKLKGEVDALGRLAAQPVHDKVRGSLPMHPYTEASFSICGLDERLMGRYQRKKQQAELEKQAILAYVDEVEPLHVAQLLILRYIDGKTWMEIWEHEGCIGSVDGYRKTLLRFLDRMEA